MLLGHFFAGGLKYEHFGFEEWEITIIIYTWIVILKSEIIRS